MSMLRRMAWMKWLPPMASASPSPQACQTVSQGFATLMPVETAVARPWMLWNP